MNARERIEKIVSELDAQRLARAAATDYGKKAAQQPWLILGISDGMGLHTTVAAIKAGLLKHAVGVFWEPPHLLELQEDGTPVSPIHRARMENAEALKEFAEQHGATFEVLFENVILAPERNLKGEVKTPAPDFPATIKTAVEKVRGDAPLKDLIFVNSVAFGKWISPREGEEPITVPSIDLTGQIVETKTKAYHARGYQETLDTMGRNHGILLEHVRELGWLGPDSLTAFYTWAGGSQNIDVLEGIYGKGALGDAKVIAERDIAKFRIDHGLTYGAHAIVRLPAFLSAALMGIPGAGLFGVISRAYLKSRNAYDDMPMLVSKLMDRAFGNAWARENPISQIEVDTAECLYIHDIQKNVIEAHRRVAQFRKEHNHEGPISVADSCVVLSGLVGDDYPAVLRRFDPSYEDDSETGILDTTERARAVIAEPVDAVDLDESGMASFEVSPTELGGLGRVPRPDLTIISPLRRLQDPVLEKLKPLAPLSETLIIERALPSDTPVSTKVRVINGGTAMTVRREFFDATGERIAVGEAQFIDEMRATGPVSVGHNLLGDVIGYRMPVREPLEEIYRDADPRVKPSMYGPALISFTQRSLAAHGFFDETTLPHTWNMRFGPRVEVGDHLLTYARREADGVVITVVNDSDCPVLQIRLS